MYGIMQHWSAEAERKRFKVTWNLHYTCISFTADVLKRRRWIRHQENQRSHILYTPSLRFSHRCEANASCDVTKGSFSGPHTPTRPTLLDSCPLPNMSNKVQQVAAFTEGCKQRATYAVFQRSIEFFMIIIIKNMAHSNGPLSTLGKKIG